MIFAVFGVSSEIATSYIARNHSGFQLISQFGKETPERVLSISAVVIASKLKAVTLFAEFVKESGEGYEEGYLEPDGRDSRILGASEVSGFGSFGRGIGVDCLYC